MKKVNILLVDDRPEGLVSLEAVLSNPDYNLVKASSGQEALAEVLAKDFAVILMDVQMPDMDGFETVSIIKHREKSKNIPVIFMTANNKAAHYVSTGYSIGAVDYMLKPLDPHILRSKVAIFVELYKKNVLIQEQTEILRDVERRDRLRSLHELELEGQRRYQNLADAIPQIVFRTNFEGKIEYFNQYWQKYTGITVSDGINQWQSVVHPKDLPSIAAEWTLHKSNQKGFECECRLRSVRSGEFRWHLLRVMPEFNDRTLVGWIGVMTDIQDQKAVQQELLLAKTLADSANETKSRFLANMSHEIRTPLGVILGFSELLNDPKSSAEEKEESISIIRRNGQQLSKIIDEILDLSKIEAGKMEVEKSEISVTDLFDGIKAFMSLPAKEKGLDLQFNVEGLIPSKIYSSSIRLQQILVNLIGNGIKFSPKGKVSVTLSFQPKSGSTSSKLFVSVKDSGPGLTASQIDQLFQPFTQIDTSMTRKYGGTGLGLALSRKLARALGGELSVEESLPHEGCCFILSIETGDTENIPLIDSLEPQKKTVEVKEKRESATLGGLKILLVEDSPDNQFLVKRFLTLEGASVDIANNGLEGVEKALHGKHDVVLMDIQMPELDGYGAISQLRQSGYRTPIIALTAHGMTEERQRCLDIGSNDHLTKPVNRVALIKRIRELSSENFV
jgi:PAS domain S-box-containing protein